MGVNCSPPLMGPKVRVAPSVPDPLGPRGLPVALLGRVSRWAIWVKGVQKPTPQGQNFLAAPKEAQCEKRPLTPSKAGGGEGG